MNYAALFDFASVRAQNFWRAFANTVVPFLEKTNEVRAALGI